MKRLLIALAVVASLWPAGVGAEETNPRAEAAFISMQWCIPPNAQVRWLTEGVRGLPWLNIMVEGYDFSLAPLPAPDWDDPMDVVSPHHPDLRLTLSVPADPLKDPPTMKRIWMLAAGCYVLSDSR